MSVANSELEILNKRGLHARAAAKFVKVASNFKATIIVCQGGTEVCGTSIMGLMMLAASKGTTISVRAEGMDAAAALEALTLLIRNRFDED